MPDNNLPPGQGRGGSVVHQQTQTIYQGPLPPPEAFEKYNRVLPGAADRILRMAEKQATHRQELESRALTGDLTKAMMGKGARLRRPARGGPLTGRRAGFWTAIKMMG